MLFIIVLMKVQSTSQSVDRAMTKRRIGPLMAMDSSMMLGPVVVVVVAGMMLIV